MEGAMAASKGALGGCAWLEFSRNKELMCNTSRRGDVRVSSFPAWSRLQHGGLTCCAEKNTLQTRKLKPLGNGILSDKKMITLLDALSKDLSVLSNSMAQSNGALPLGDASLADQARGRILADALEAVMTQLAEVKAERKQRKRQLKALKKALKARKDKSSSTSTSESADRVCEVIDVSQLCGSSQQEKPTAENDPQVDSPPILGIPAVLREKFPEGAGGEEGLHLEFGRTADRLGVSRAVAEQPSGDKIEVCMGPKCKKMGSDQLLAAFEGCGVEAVGCKCMGKCRSAPNVRVHKLRFHGDDGRRSQLHLGVGIGEVDLIVSHHFGQQIQGGAVVPA